METQGRETHHGGADHVDALQEILEAIRGHDAKFSSMRREISTRAVTIKSARSYRLILNSESASVTTGNLSAKTNAKLDRQAGDERPLLGHELKRFVAKIMKKVAGVSGVCPDCPKARHRGSGRSQLTHRTRPNAELCHCSDHGRLPYTIHDRWCRPNAIGCNQ